MVAVGVCASMTQDADLFIFESFSVFIVWDFGLWLRWFGVDSILWAFY